jgi:hypothetical protein
LQGDEHAAADSGLVGGDIGEHDPEQAGEEEGLAGADEGERPGQ